jgi:hypothetical protein
MSAKTTMLPAIATVLLAAASAAAVEFGPGTREYAIGGSFSRDTFELYGDDTTQTRVMLDLGVGFFLDEHVELLAEFLVDYDRLEGTYRTAYGDGDEFTLTTSAYGLGGGVRFNIPRDDDTATYLGAGFAFVTHGGDTSYDETSTLAPILELGVRLFIGDSAAANIGLNYTHVTNDGGYESRDRDTLMLQLGFSIFP